MPRCEFHLPFDNFQIYHVDHVRDNVFNLILFVIFFLNCPLLWLRSLCCLTAKPFSYIYVTHNDPRVAQMFCHIKNRLYIYLRNDRRECLSMVSSCSVNDLKLFKVTPLLKHTTT